MPSQEPDQNRRLRLGQGARPLVTNHRLKFPKIRLRNAWRDYPLL